MRSSVYHVIRKRRYDNVKKMMKRLGLGFLIAFLLTVLLPGISPMRQVEAGGPDITFRSDSDMDEKLDQANELETGKTVAVTEGALVSATYPSKIDYVQDSDPDDQSYDDYYDVAMATGEGYLFKLTVPYGKAAVVTTEGEAGNDVDVRALVYNTVPGEYEGWDDFSWMKKRFSDVIRKWHNPFPLINYYDDTYDMVTYLFIPKNSGITSLSVEMKTRSGSNAVGDGSADKVTDYLDKALEVKAGEDFQLADAEKITVVTNFSAIRSWMNQLSVTEKVTGRMLHVTLPENETLDYYMEMDRKTAYHNAWLEGDTFYNGTFTLNAETKSIWLAGNIPEHYIFLPEGAEFVKWTQSQPYDPDDPIYDPVVISDELKKDKVNVVSWDNDLERALKDVYKVHPELESKVNFINLGVAGTGDEYLSTLQDIAGGKYDGYTIVVAAEVSLQRMFGDFPALSEIGFKDSDYSDAYAYTKKIGSSDGKLRAVTWYVCPNGFFYDSRMAKEVLGTDDPAKVQAMIATPAKFNDVAKKMKAAGYSMTSGVYKLKLFEDSYRATGYEGEYNTVLLDLMDTYDAASYDTGADMWMSDWVNDMVSGKVFGSFGTAWMHYVYTGNGVADGTYKLCQGPVSYNWGGSFVLAKDLGTQGKTAAQLLKALTCDDAAMKAIATDKGDVVNNKSVNRALAKDDAMKDPFYADSQNPISIWHAAALARGGEEDVVLKGWIQEGTDWYYYKDGKALTGWQKLSQKWYYFNKSGKMLTGWQKIGQKWYYFNKSGKMLTGWQKIGQKWYYFSKSGNMLTGWQQIGKKWYFFSTAEKTLGQVQTGWKKSGGKWYYLSTESSTLGEMVTGWKQIGKNWYFFDGGAMKTGWQKIGGKWYYFDSEGVMVTGKRAIGGKNYNFDSAGVCLNP